jgi:glycine oxidase
MLDKADVVIVGGGVIGWSIAYHLRRAGMEVCLVERAEAGAGASGAAAGLLAPLGSMGEAGAFADLLLASWRALPELIAELEQRSGIRVEYEQSGALRLVRQASAVEQLRRRLERWQPLGLQLSWLTGEEARGREPLLSSDVQAAVYAPQEGQLQAPLLAKALVQASLRAGVRCHERTAISGFVQRGAEVLALETAGGEQVGCAHVVIAAGAWSAQLGQLLGVTIPVSPLRGQILALRQPAPPLKHLVFGEGIYLAPKADGTVVVGATREEAGFDLHLTAGGIAWLLTTALRLVPALADCPLERLWVGLRPGTPDQRPLLGPLPGWKNVTVATGHGSVGILLSAVTGRAIAELISTGWPPPLIRPFGLERFAPPSRDA